MSARTFKNTSKTKPFAIRLSDAERVELERRAGEMALGTYIKTALFADGDDRRRRGARAPVKDHAALAQVLACLGQSCLGESMQQLSDAAKSGTLYIDDDVPKAIEQACEDIVVMRLLLMRALGFQMPDDADLPLSVSELFADVASGCGDAS
ncbi:hypothetical protein [Ahrensia sp. 13_GOM-1096m]|uniref:hypothetical protein n=1 Tax=Ahrensia sp. 13_GOM-1096m TaxID=1380380 RepID=UPI000685717F|nr:hypothetical protein [Ahrensia sp. 13_GOM-1096m]